MRFVDCFQLEINCPLCLNCHSLLRSKHFLCQRCYDILLKNHFQLSAMNLNSEINHYSFIEWKKNQSDTISGLVHHLKRSYSEDFWNEMAGLCAELLRPLLSTKLHVVFIPIPGHKTSFHTHYFSTALAKHLRAKCLIDALGKTNDQEQKLKNKIDRSSIRFNWNEEFTQKIPSNCMLVLTDDIITTGATLKNTVQIVQKQLIESGTHNVKVISVSLFHRTI